MALTPKQLEKAAARKRAWRKRKRERETTFNRVMKNWKRTNKNDPGYIY